LNDWQDQGMRPGLPPAASDHVMQSECVREQEEYSRGQFQCWFFIDMVQPD
jgi:hypothetical protein